MPLVVDPTTMSSSSKDNKDDSSKDNTNDQFKAAESTPSDQPPSEEEQGQWLAKLMGKTVKPEEHSEINFARSDLPKESRIVKEGDMVTRDFKPERMNVHLAEDETVRSVTFG